MKTIPLFLEEYLSFYGIGCAQNLFLIYVHPCRVWALIEYSRGVTINERIRMVERELCVFNLVNAIIKWIVRNCI